ncbi:2-phospho-L-lactate transferase CofD family protein, partial [Clostridioides difficile]
IPATDQPLILNAEMEDGSIVHGESLIPLQGKHINRVYIEPENVKPYPTAVEAVKEADLIVIGPGSLYITSATKVKMSQFQAPIITPTNGSKALPFFKLISSIFIWIGSGIRVKN